LRKRRSNMGGASGELIYEITPKEQSYL